MKDRVTFLVGFTGLTGGFVPLTLAAMRLFPPERFLGLDRGLVGGGLGIMAIAIGFALVLRVMSKDTYGSSGFTLL